MRPVVLVLDDHDAFLERVSRILSDRWSVRTARTAAEGLRVLEAGGVAALLLDLNLGDGPDGYDVLRRLREARSDVPVVVVSVKDHPQDVVQAMQLGAADFRSKTDGPEEIRLAVERVIEHASIRREHGVMRRQLRGDRLLVFGRSPAMQRVREETDRYAPLPGPVLILGERGVGKDLVARAIHERSPRRDRVFTKVNCNTIPDDLGGTLLFGHERGAFTGAVRRHHGYFEEADGGTLFLDEVFDLAPRVQGDLLRVIEDGRIRRVGLRSELEVDVRVVAATNRSIETGAGCDGFRSDLADRLRRYVIRVPPLRDRKEDIPLLVEELLRRMRAAGILLQGLTPRAVDRVISYDWPGNIRELENALWTASAWADGPLLDAQHFSLPVAMTESMRYWDARREAMHRFQREFLMRALRLEGGNITRAAELIGLQRSAFQRMMRQCGLRDAASIDRPPSEGVVPTPGFQSQ